MVIFFNASGFPSKKSCGWSGRNLLACHWGFHFTLYTLTHTKTLYGLFYKVACIKERQNGIKGNGTNTR